MTQMIVTEMNEKAIIADRVQKLIEMTKGFCNEYLDEEPILRP